MMLMVCEEVTWFRNLIRECFVVHIYIMKTSWHGNTSHITEPVRGESISDRWIQRANYEGLMFWLLLICLNKLNTQWSDLPVIWVALLNMWRHCNVNISMEVWRLFCELKACFVSRIFTWVSIINWLRVMILFGGYEIWLYIFVFYSGFIYFTCLFVISVK